MSDQVGKVTSKGRRAGSELSTNVTNAAHGKYPDRASNRPEIRSALLMNSVIMLS